MSQVAPSHETQQIQLMLAADRTPLGDVQATLERIGWKAREKA